MAYTVKQLATLAGISKRTLHYYDELGLLKPKSVEANGYRSYDDESILKLQQILFYRELDFPLQDIKRIMERPDFDILGALESHRTALQKRIERLNRLIQTLENTILYLKGKKEMGKKQLFEALSESQQEEYAKQAEEKYDPEMVRKVNKKWKDYGKEKQQVILAEGNSIYEEMVKAIPFGAESREAQECVERWRRHLDYFWTPSLDQLTGLAGLYVTPDFKKNFDKIDPRLAEFMGKAVEIYVGRHKS